MSRDCGMIVIGGSSGGLQAVLRILEGLEPDFCIPVAIVLHQLRHPAGRLTGILQSRTKHPVIEPVDKETIQAGTIYVAPPDYHLLMEADHSFSYSYSESVNYSRPSIDLLFESAARAYRDQLTGILLTGANHDGAAGMYSISERGGLTVIQDPAEADMPFMPRAALEMKKPDHLLPINEIINLLNLLPYGSNASV